MEMKRASLIASEQINSSIISSIPQNESFGKGSIKNRRDSAFESQDQLNITNNQSSSFKCDSVNDIAGQNARKKSLPNIIFRNHRPSAVPAYALKKKFSLGQVKVRPIHVLVAFR